MKGKIIMFNHLIALAAANGEEATSSAINQAVSNVSEAASEAASEFSEGVNEAINDNQFLNSIKETLQKYTTSSAIIGLVAKLLIAALILVLAVVISKFLCKVIIKALEKKGTDHSIFGFIQTVIKAAVFIIAIISALSSLGMNITSLVAALASAGVALGLGLQGCISQLVSGIMIIVNKPFRKGDFVEVKGVQGTISGIYIMYTVIHTVDNKKIIIPNSDITSNYIINYSAEELRRCDIDIGISYSDDISLAKSVIMGIAESCPSVIRDPEPFVCVVSHDSSQITLQIRAWCNSSDYWNTFFYIQENTKSALEKNGITIPFNQLDVHVINNK